MFNLKCDFRETTLAGSPRQNSYQSRIALMASCAKLKSWKKYNGVILNGGWKVVYIITHTCSSLDFTVSKCWCETHCPFSFKENQKIHQHLGSLHGLFCGFQRLQTKFRETQMEIRWGSCWTVSLASSVRKEGLSGTGACCSSPVFFVSRVSILNPK